MVDSLLASEEAVLSTVEPEESSESALRADAAPFEPAKDPPWSSTASECAVCEVDEEVWDSCSEC